MEKISIIIPVYFNEENLKPLYDDLAKEVLHKLECAYEIIFVDDGSQDESYKMICELADNDQNIIPVKLSRNFGSHAAILAGLSVASGDCITVKAADMQEPSELILEMYRSWKSGNNVVLAVRSDREESSVQKFFSNTYYNIMSKFVLPTMPKGGFDCFLIDKKVAIILTAMEEKNTSLMGQILWSGFKSDKIYYVRKKREIGKSKWTLAKKVKLFVDSILGFSYLPIRCISMIGVLFFVCSIVGSGYILWSKLFKGIPVQGWATLTILLLFSSGTIMLTLGVLGEYLWRTFDAARKRPVYIIEDMKNHA